MATVTAYNSDTQDVTREPKWFVFDVTGTIGTTVNEDIALMTVPGSTIVLDWKLKCLTGDTGATSSRWNLQVDNDGTPSVLTAGTADNGGVAGVTDVAELGGTLAMPLADDGSVYTLETNHVIVGTTTVASAVRVAVLMCRTTRPTTS